MTIGKNIVTKRAGNPRLVTTDYNNTAGDISSIIVSGNRIFRFHQETTCISDHFHLYIGFFFSFFFFVSTGEGQAGPQRAEHGATAPSWHPKLEGWTSGVEKRGRAVVKAHALIPATFQTCSDHAAFLFLSPLSSSFPRTIFLHIFNNP